MMALTVKVIDKAKPQDKPYKLTDGRGLYLQVMPNGSKYWRLAYRYLNKQKTLALGVYPNLSLSEARKAREDAKSQLANDIDPSAHKKAKRAAKLEAASNSFELVARLWFEKHMFDKSDSHKKRTLRTLEKDIFPHLGRRPIGEIERNDLLSVLEKIQGRGAIETARRANQTCGQIFRYAMVKKLAKHDISSKLHEMLKKPVETHYPAITSPPKVAELLRAIDSFNGTPVVTAALKLSPLLFCRPGELRHMEWDEINWTEKRWEIPGKKMKSRSDHIVPLSKQAQIILEEIHLTTGLGKYAFPSARGASRPLSENGVRTALRTMGYDNQSMTPHGFRAMARTILDEVLNTRVEVIEAQMAHTVKDANGRAYNRTTFLQQRTEMMQTWADYLDGLKTENDANNIIHAKFG